MRLTSAEVAAIREGSREKDGKVSFFGFFLILLFIAICSASAETPAARPASVDAHRVIAALKVEQQIDFLVPKLAPTFASQLFDAPIASEQFKAELATPEGRARLRVIAQEEFARAFRSHVAEMLEMIGRDYDQRLSPADLHEVAEFLSKGAGARWATNLVDMQQASSNAGARLGALAGEEAFIATAKRVEGGKAQK